MHTENQNNDLDIPKNLLSNIKSDVFCVFNTKLDNYKISEVPISLSTEITHNDLSKVINEMLVAEGLFDESPDVSFEFLVNQTFLRGSLRSHIYKHKLSKEENLHIEYVLSQAKPKLNSSNPEEDWICNLLKIDSQTKKNNNDQSFMSSLFNGTVSFFDRNAQKLNNMKFSDEIIKTSCVAGALGEYLVSGTIDGKLILSKIVQNTVKKAMSGRKGSSENTIKLETLNTMGKLEKTSIECQATNPMDSEIFISSGSNKIVYLWKLDKNSLESQDRTKNQFRYYHEIAGHTDTVTSLDWLNYDNFLTGSIDHTQSIFNVQKSTEVFNINFKDTAVTKLCYAPLSSLIFTGHEDGNIRIFDEKARNKTALKLCKSHTKWISDIKVHPVNQNIFASASYDGLVKIWDMRSDFPLSSIKIHKDKLFCQLWLNNDYQVSGGSDSKVCVHKFA